MRGRSKRILIGFRFVEALRDVLQGIISYSKAQNTNWELQGVDMEVFELRNELRKKNGPAGLTPQRGLITELLAN